MGSSFLASAQQAAPTYSFDVPAQPLADALTSIGQQCTTNVLFDPRSVERTTAPPLHATLTTKQAIDRLLADTPLVARQTNSGTILVEPRAAAVTTRASSATASPDTATGDVKEGKQESSHAFRMARVDQGQTSDTGSLNTPLASESAITLQEVIVTAQKRAERLQDVPVPVAVLSGEALVQNNQVRLEDYYTQVPGLSIATSNFGQPSVVIRGLTTGGAASNPTVGVVVDDVPYGASTFSGGGAIFPDIDPGDLQSIEVLKGPQGTLYGASSLGGLVKFVTKDPSTAGVTARVEGALDGVSHGDGEGYNARGSVNIPLGDTLAVRASGYFRRDPGYVDNIVSGARGVNKTDSSGGRLSFLWKPADSFSLKLGALLQREKQDGYDAADALPGLGSPRQNTVPGAGASDRRYQVYTATVNARLGIAEVTSITGYSINSIDGSRDFGVANPTFGPQYIEPVFGVSGLSLTDVNRTSKVSEELRARMTLGQRIDWLVGGYYTHEFSPYLDQFLALNQNTGALVAPTIGFDSTESYSEFAGYTDLTVHFTANFDTQFGVRETQIRQSYLEVDNSSGAGGVDWVDFFDGFPGPYDYGGKLHSKNNAFTYLITPRWQISENTMAYVRLASGFRPGGPNGGIPPQFQVSPLYGADKTQNYEVGLKGDFLDRRLTVDGSIYYIDWRDIQISAYTPSEYAYIENTSRAKSEGAELSAQARPLEGIVVAAWVAWNEAVVTQNFPPASTTPGQAGDRLAYSPRWSGNLSIDDELARFSGMRVFVGGDLSYVGNRLGSFQPVGTDRGALPSFTKLDLHAGLKSGDWTVRLFANNATDRRGLLANDFYPYVSVIVPRTLGVSVAREFGP